ncbi:MAG TPA: GntR family transcriptional regulator [Rhodocyclaceae bacterium]|nr:GntR family transcriptional regulator [Rhodocyclaceae bacterium]
MTSQLETVTQRLRDLILAGEVAPGQRLGEIAVAEMLQASRTPVRLAMAALETEGLLMREPNRGFRVRSFTIDEIADAIEVRGELEAMAARLAAERGVSPELARSIASCLDEAEALTESGLEVTETRLAWIDCNARFHRALVELADNAALASAIDHVSRIPLAGARAIVFVHANSERNVAQIRASNLDHRHIFDAVRRRQGTRAAALVREHAYRSACNKRENFQAMKGDRLGLRLPGADLVT